MEAQEDTGRVLVVAGVFFGGLAAAAFAAGVFSRLDQGEAAALIAFAVLFAIATCVLDRGVRRYLGGAFRKAAGASPAARPAAPSSARTNARGWDATRGQAGD